ncbi:hypothetical protein SAY86_014666 [Trapa natans]|uniref:Glabrous enhancer-binding protein-like DBD domain-containing protein n=1 Tax=Trapa natans TaxID=22666 RepID=A0AAN7KP01_TRANT|nr:hypothetical protein SAY86_014666 [Trapa natans]
MARKNPFVSHSSIEYLSEEEEPSYESTGEPKSSQHRIPMPKPLSAVPVHATPALQDTSSSPESNAEFESESEHTSDSDEPSQPLKNSKPTSFAHDKHTKFSPSEPSTKLGSDITPLDTKSVEVRGISCTTRQSLKRPHSDLEDTAKIDTCGQSQAIGEESSKKLRFQKVWTEEDEITLLRGILKYGENPSTNMINFHGFIKGRLQFNAAPSQLSSKIRTLKKKFMKWEAKVKEGKSLKSDIQQIFELSSKIWGSEHGILKNKISENTSNPTILVHKKNKAIVKEELDNSVAAQGSLLEDELFDLLKGRVSHHFLRGGLNLINDSSWEESWKKLNLAELKLASEKYRMIHEKINLIIDAFENS